MDYLICAEQYAEAHGDENYFKWIYTCNRENFDIEHSVWLTLKYLYSDQIADQLQRIKYEQDE
jgi:hypothetical protein